MATLRLPDARCAWAVRVILATRPDRPAACASSAHALRNRRVDHVRRRHRRAGERRLAAPGPWHAWDLLHQQRATSAAPDPYFMNWSQLDGIAAAGHEIAGHTRAPHALPPSPPPSSDPRSATTPRHFERAGTRSRTSPTRTAPAPRSPPCCQALQDCGYLNARSVGELRGDNDCASCPFGESLPPANPYAIRTAPLPARCDHASTPSSCGSPRSRRTAAGGCRSSSTTSATAAPSSR